MLINEAGYKPDLRLYIALMAYQGLRGHEVAMLTGQQIDLKARPPVLRNGGKTTILHKTVVQSFKAPPPLSDSGRIFPNRKPHNISHIVNEHIRACGLDATANSLRVWHGRQAENFDRTPDLREPSEHEQRIIAALEHRVPKAWRCYRQALEDLSEEGRISFRGAANELRFAVEEVLTEMAPDADVTASPGYIQDATVNGPTHAQKGRYISKLKGLDRSNRQSLEATLKLIDDHVGDLSRGLFTRSSSSAHNESERGEVMTIKEYVNAFLGDVFDIHRTS